MKTVLSNTKKMKKTKKKKENKRKENVYESVEEDKKFEKTLKKKNDIMDYGVEICWQ